jgi:hypothetical protein
MLQEVLRGDDRHVGARVHHAQHTAEVIDMRMGVDHRGHRPVAAVLPVQCQPRRGHLGRHRRIDHDHPGLALDHGHVRQLDPAQLVYTVGDLEQALDRRELALPPQARVHRVRTVARHRLRERISVVHDSPVSGLDHPWFQPGDQPTLGVLEIGPVTKVHRHPNLHPATLPFQHHRAQHHDSPASPKEGDSGHTMS